MLNLIKVFLFQKKGEEHVISLYGATIISGNNRGIFDYKYLFCKKYWNWWTLLNLKSNTTFKSQRILIATPVFIKSQDRGETSIGTIARPVALSSIFTKWVNLKRGSCLDSHPPTTETAIFVKSQVKKSLFSIARGALQACVLYYTTFSTRC